MAEEQQSLRTDQLSDLQDLLQHRGWELLLDVLSKNVKIRENIILRRRCRSVEDLYEQEFLKGEVSGIRFVLALPSTIVSVAGEVRKAELKLEGKEDDDQVEPL